MIGKGAASKDPGMQARGEGVRRRGGGWGRGEGGTAKGEQGRGKILEPLDILDAGAPTQPCACFFILFNIILRVSSRIGSPCPDVLTYFLACHKTGSLGTKPDPPWIPCGSPTGSPIHIHVNSYDLVRIPHRIPHPHSRKSI